jgi:hypothetical protein
MKYLTDKVEQYVLKKRLYSGLLSAAVKEVPGQIKIFNESQSAAIQKFGNFVQKCWFS